MIFSWRTEQVSCVSLKVGAGLEMTQGSVDEAERIDKAARALMQVSMGVKRSTSRR